MAEDNKAWLEPLEAYLGIGFNWQFPAVPSAVSHRLTVQELWQGYPCCVGSRFCVKLLQEDMLQQQDTLCLLEQTLQMIEYGPGVRDFGPVHLVKGPKAAGVTDDIINAVNKTGNGIGDELVYHIRGMIMWRG